MKAILPAAGYATRLYPLTLNTPKPLLKIKEKPVIEYIIEKILELNINDIFIVTNNKFYSKFLEWSQTKNFSVKILNDGTSSNEERLGSLGDIQFVLDKEKIEDDVLIINADNLFDFSLKEMYEYFKIKKNVIGLYDVKDLEIAKRMGAPELEKDKVIGFKEKPENPTSTLASLGIYMYNKETIKLLKEYLKKYSPDKTGEFLEWVHKQTAIYGFELEGKCFDIGNLEILNKVRKEFK